MELYSCIFITMILTLIVQIISGKTNTHKLPGILPFLCFYMLHYTAPRCLQSGVRACVTASHQWPRSSPKQSLTLAGRVSLPLCWDKHNWKFLPPHPVTHQRSFLCAYYYTPHLILSSLAHNSTVDPNFLYVIHFTCVGYLFVLHCYF